MIRQCALRAEGPSFTQPRASPCGAEDHNGASVGPTGQPFFQTKFGPLGRGKIMRRPLPQGVALGWED